ncbi:chemotaxis protein CheX [Dactylosporangium sp. NPDC049525]|uniref:chemotaxis protein CheX n=1 Tax=Dactylosporangium sp. NPDC049525 TaxID=3154730 RepID=UPI00343888F0
MNPETSLSEDDLRGIVWQVWTAYLHCTPEVEDSAEPMPDTADVTASVGVAGAWNGLAVIRCGLPAAGEIAGAMLDIDPANANPDDCTDALGELVNILAGNVKSLLPKPSHLSLPQVVLGRAKVVWPGTTPLHTLRATINAEPTILGVLRGDPKPT